MNGFALFLAHKGRRRLCGFHQELRAEAEERPRRGGDACVSLVRGVIPLLPLILGGTDDVYKLDTSSLQVLA
jgi:hypothetical protein